MAANARRTATIIFCLLAISRSQTIKIGKIPNVQSASELITEAAYVVATITVGVMQYLVPAP